MTVNSVQPGLHATDRVHAVYGAKLKEEELKIPARELGRPEDFGRVIAFLSSAHARESLQLYND